MAIPIRVAEVGTGWTINISSSGVAFLIEAPIEPGMAIEFVMTMDEDRGLEMRCGGTVVRAEPRGAMTLTAVTIDDLSVARAATEH
jgi:hypothetical protein